ncbi:hypothetical protein [Chryseobacterium daeguense]|uniref:hypothetical protein n=1 Tax=Chryseobacterium daeguense TaxID=412438 RepID=UPI0003FA27A0|nr:hypothetical protein [Chryseobacterium daeguense]
MLKNYLYTLGVLLLLLLSNCREEVFQSETASELSKTQINAKTTLGIYESNYPYNVNVVYFIPSD